MAIRDLLLTLVSHPDPTPSPVVDCAVALAATLHAHIAAVACESHVQVPGSFLSFGHAGAMAAAEANASRRTAQAQLAAFDAAAERAGVPHETFLDRCLSHEAPDRLADHARLHDLTIVQQPKSHDRGIVEALIFGSGRPTLILPVAPPRGIALNKVVVAWDFSRSAARAVADAMPILDMAKEVHVLTVTGEKAIATSRSATELAKNLARHGITVVVDEVVAAGRPIGDVLTTQADACQADLLVMGAYGHSRFREFVLGGATESMLSKPPLPVLLAH